MTSMMSNTGSFLRGIFYSVVARGIRRRIYLCISLLLGEVAAKLNARKKKLKNSSHGHERGLAISGAG